MATKIGRSRLGTIGERVGLFSSENAPGRQRIGRGESWKENGLDRSWDGAELCFTAVRCASKRAGSESWDCGLAVALEEGR